MEVSIPGFTIYRADIDTLPHGGVCIYLKSSIEAVSTIAYSTGEVEGLVIKVRSLNLILFNICRPPKAKVEDFKCVLTKVREEMLFIQANSNKFGDIVGFGDFNFPDIPWPDTTIQDKTSSIGLQTNLLLEFLNCHFLTQMVSAPTRERNCLDLV